MSEREKGLVDKFLEGGASQKEWKAEEEDLLVPSGFCFMPEKRLCRSVSYNTLSYVLDLPPGHEDCKTFGQRRELEEAKYESSQKVLNMGETALLPTILGEMHKELVTLIAQEAEGGSVLFLDERMIWFRLRKGYNTTTEEKNLQVSGYSRAIVIPSSYGRLDEEWRSWGEMGWVGLESISAAVEEYQQIP